MVIGVVAPQSGGGEMRRGIVTRTETAEVEAEAVAAAAAGAAGDGAVAAVHLRPAVSGADTIHAQRAATLAASGTAGTLPHVLRLVTHGDARRRLTTDRGTGMTATTVQTAMSAEVGGVAVVGASTMTVPSRVRLRQSREGSRRTMMLTRCGAGCKPPPEPVRSLPMDRTARDLLV